MLKFRFDDHHLLVLEFEDRGYSKEYSVCLSGYQISSKDKGILIYNKRQWRIIHFKEISEGMQACFLQDKSIGTFDFNVAMLENAFALFQGFNEETGEKYHYLPFYSKNVESLEKDVKDFFGLELKISKESQGNFVRGVKSSYYFPKNFSDILSFIFSLVGIYGRFDEKDGEVSAVRVHIPLVGGTRIDEELNDCFKKLAEEYGIFFAAQRVQNGNKTIYQFASNDREVLALFVYWMNYYCKNDDLKLDYYLQKQQEIKGQLIEYIQQEKDLNLDGRDEVLKLLSEHNLKFIKCF